MSNIVSPIIITGMHRSGTTMVANMLRQLGLFIGNDLEENSESKFFINHNNWLLLQSGGSWDNPKPIQWFYDNNEVVSLTEDYIRERMGGIPVINYLGLRRFALGQKPLSGLNQAWGWKDPRTSFTLPFWLRIFPNARVIHIYRNGVPVAASLRSREARHLYRAELKHKTRKAMGVYRLISKQNRFVSSIRCLSLEGGFALWEEYVSQAIAMVEKTAPNSIDIKYEDFLDDPVDHLTKILGFCGIESTIEQIKSVASEVNPSRANAFESDDELANFYSTVRARPLMRQLGY